MFTDDRRTDGMGCSNSPQPQPNSCGLKDIDHTCDGDLACPSVKVHEPKYIFVFFHIDCCLPSSVHVNFNGFVLFFNSNCVIDLWIKNDFFKF